MLQNALYALVSTDNRMLESMLYVILLSDFANIGLNNINKCT